MKADEKGEIGVDGRIYIKPSWGQAGVAKAVTGVPVNVIRNLVNDHVVRARKGDPQVKHTFTVFCIADIEDWLESGAPAAGPFKLYQPKKEEAV